jgi:drug/metabolite transporter (DMT)-like permease
LAPAARPLDRIALAVMVVLCASWGFQYVATKVALVDVPPLTQAGARSVLATLIVGAIAMARKIDLFGRDGSGFAGLCAGLLFSAMLIGIFVGLQWTNSSRVVLFVYTAPFFVALGSLWLLPGERLRRPQWLGLALAFAGVAAAVAAPARGGGALGDLMAIGAGAAWGATTLLIKASPLRAAAPVKVFLYQFGVSGIVVSLAGVIAGEPLPAHFSAMTALSLLYQTVWICAVTYLIWFAMIARYRAGELSVFTFLTPVIGVLAGHFVLDEPISATFAFGVLLLAAGIALVSLPERALERAIAAVAIKGQS